MSGAWTTSCLALLPTPLPTGVGDRNGQHISEFNGNITLRIDWNTCNTYCNSSQIPLTFNFQNFAGAFTNFFLPWLALTAQLPYESDHPMSNFMSAVLALGSPVLITYSLSITIFNRLWAREQFNRQHSRAGAPLVAQRYPMLADRIKCIQYFIQECQQVPMRVSRRLDCLAGLLVYQENQPWWRDLVERLKSTRRPTTNSLVAQITVAAAAWLLTIIASFSGHLGDLAVSLQVSGGSLWLWMIPIIIGWVIVGTQSNCDSIDMALKAKEAIFHSRSGQTISREQLVFVNSSGANLDESELPDASIYPSPTCLLTNVRGDERRIGPAFNYARALTWSKFAITIDIALDNLITSLEREQPYNEPNMNRHLSITSTAISPTDQRNSSADAEGSCNQTSYICGPRELRITSYPTMKEVPTEIKKNMIAASLIGLFVQWGTTGASIMMAYKIPTVGLSCRSGGYLIYGCMATLIWLLLVVSMGLSHKAMLDFQRSHEPNNDANIARDLEVSSANSSQPSTKRRFAGTWRCRVVHVLAVLTLGLGKVLAVVNSCWLVLSSLLEMIGGYENCFCKTNYINLRERGSVLFFRSAAEITVIIQDHMKAGVAFSVIVCAIAMIFFYYCCRE